jgi:CheY-like chemotaxis protein
MTPSNPNDQHDAPRVAVIDDDPDQLEFYRLVLEPEGYTVDAYSGRDAALAAFAETPPDLVVTDLMMETLDAGFAFAQTLRESGRLRTVPIILVTAVASQRGFDFSPRNEEELRGMQVDAFLTKPVEPADLVHLVEDLLRR